MDKTTKKINQILRISKMYYELNMGQVAIAKAEGISKSTVSRLLQNGRDMGLIEIKIKEPVLAFSDLENQLLDHYPLKSVTIVPDLVGNKQILLHDVCSALAEDLPDYIEDNSVIGVAWGRTLELLSTLLSSINREGVSVIQFSGGYSRAVHESGALKILSSFAESVGGNAYMIPAPAVVDAPFIADAIKQDSQIKHILTMAENCKTAIFSVGNLARPSVIYEMGLLSDEQYRDMEAEGCVGDCCSHFLNADGDIFDPDFDRRVVGVSIETLKAVPNKVLVVSGIEKASIIRATLNGGLADRLYIDAPTAKAVLK